MFVTAGRCALVCVEKVHLNVLWAHLIVPSPRCLIPPSVDYPKRLSGEITVGKVLQGAVNGWARESLCFPRRDFLCVGSRLCFLGEGCLE